MKRSYRLIAATLCATLLAACGGSNGFFSSSPTSVTPSLGSQPAFGRHAAGPLGRERVLYTFTGAPNAAGPFGRLLAGKHNEFYGISNGGGTVGPSGFTDGTVYEISTTGQERVLYDFQGGNDGAGSEAGLIADRAGNLFGTNDFGGGSSACTNGCGTVFELSPSGSGYTERVIHAFQSGADGASPLASLLLGKNGVLYGTTDAGGASGCASPSGYTGCGTVFSLTPSGSQYVEKILYSFQGGSDGATPRASLVADAAGNLYGTTEFGGKTNSACGNGPSGNVSCGIVFELTRSGHEKVLYRFKGGTHDGSNSRAALLLLSNGSFVGLTPYGGAKHLGYGTAFELTPGSGTYTERVIHFFGQTSEDGIRPQDADGLAADAGGNLYGATALSLQSPCGCGAVFELSPSASGYSEQVLHYFQGGPDGALPHGSVIVRNGIVYGTTLNGGSYCYGSSYSCGVVYKVRR